MMQKLLEKLENGLVRLTCITKGDSLRATAVECRMAAAATDFGPTARMIRKMALEYETKADKADAEDRRLADMVKH